MRRSAKECSRRRRRGTRSESQYYYTLLPTANLTFHRALDEKARIQREREEAAEAKLAAKKAGRFGADRPISRDAPAEPSSAAAPPRIALPGGKMTWREREAMKAAGQTPPPAAGAAPAPAESASPAPPAEAEAPKRGGYVPPALRAAGGAAPGGGWREREASGSGRGPPARPERTESPATGGRFEAPSRGGRSFGDDRKASPASGGGYVPPSRRGQADGEERESAPPPAQGASDGKYRPGAFRRTPGQ